MLHSVYMHKSFSVCIFLENYVCLCVCVRSMRVCMELNSPGVITAIIRRKIAHDKEEKEEEEILKLYES